MSPRHKTSGGDLGRIPPQSAPRDVIDPMDAEDPSRPRVADLVAWMVERLHTREALETALADGALGGRRHSDRFLTLVDVAVTLSRLQAGEDTLDPDLLDLRTTIEASHRSLSGTDPDTLDLEIEEDVPAGVYADAAQLERVLAALISIATPVGGGESTIHVERAVKDPRRTASACVLAFEIRAAAVGPLAGDATSADPVPQAARRLGLAVCAELVSMMGGELASERAPGREGTFWLTFPKTSAVPEVTA